jgi:hypothetical protein
MRWGANRTIETDGILAVHQIVNAHGSILRKFDQGTDIGIDATIELTEEGVAQGLLVAVQIKSGESYARRNEFVVPVDQAHLTYWQSLMLPVIIICHPPKRKITSWISVHHFLQQEGIETERVKNIRIPYQRQFCSQALSKGIRAVARAYKDERALFPSADMVLSEDPATRQQGLFLLTIHPASRLTRLTAKLAAEMILDAVPDNVRLAIRALAYCTANYKWEGCTNWDVFFFAQRLCFGFGQDHLFKILDALDDGDFSRQSLGEACIDCITYMRDGETFARELVLNKTCDIHIRANALALFYGGDWDALAQDTFNLQAEGLDDILQWLQEAGNGPSVEASSEPRPTT